MLIGGTTAQTRVPSPRRASTIGVVRSRRRPSGARIRSITTARSAAAIDPRRSSSPARSTQISPPPLTRTSSTHASRISTSSGPRPSSRATAASTSRSRSTAQASGASAANVLTHRHFGAARLPLGGQAQRGHESLVDVAADDVGRGTHAATRSVCSDLTMARGSRAASRPASTARAIAGSTVIRATTGAPTARATSAAVRLRPCSSTRTMPSGRGSRQARDSDR